jgi:hypothetical protein
MAEKSITMLADEVRLGLADLSAVAKDDEFARAMGNVHERAREALRRIEAAKRYRAALRAERLDVGMLAPGERKACETGRQTARRVATQLLSQEGKRSGLLTGEAIEQALGAATTAWKTIVVRSNQAVAAEQARLRPTGLDQPVPDVPGAQRLRVELQRHQQKLQGSVGVLPEKLLELAAGDEARELRELRAAAEKWKELHAQLLEGLQQQPLEVQRFIRAASSEAGAPLSLLTKEIRDWLEQAGATDNFVIRSH